MDPLVKRLSLKLKSMKRIINVLSRMKSAGRMQLPQTRNTQKSMRVSTKTTLTSMNMKNWEKRSMNVIIMRK